jgi:hypothetical protein
MQKLLAAYQAKPTFTNARRVRAYERSHPMCLVLLTRDEANMVADAIHHANTPQD